MKDQRDKLYEPSNSSLLVYPVTGLIRLNCPIIAECVLSVGPYKPPDFVEIVGIGYTRDDPLMYLIDGRFYSHRHFRIHNLNLKNK